MYRPNLHFMVETPSPDMTDTLTSTVPLPASLQTDNLICKTQSPIISDEIPKNTETPRNSRMANPPRRTTSTAFTRCTKSPAKSLITISIDSTPNISFPNVHKAPDTQSTNKRAPNGDSQKRPSRPEWAIDCPPQNSTYQGTLISPRRTLHIAFSKLSHFGAARAPEGLVVDVFARYCFSSKTLWVAVHILQFRKSGIRHGDMGPVDGDILQFHKSGIRHGDMGLVDGEESIMWMLWSTYVQSELSRKPWMRVGSWEYSNVFGRLSEEAVVKVWVEQNEQESQQAMLEGSFESGRVYRQCLSDCA